MLLGVLLLPFKIVATVIRLLLRIIFFPLKLIVAGCLLQIGVFLVMIVIVGVLAYFIYRWLT